MRLLYNYNNNNNSYNNIYKFHQVNLQADDMLLIDNNEKIAKKIDSLGSQMMKDERFDGSRGEDPLDGFSSGLDPDEVDALLGELENGSGDENIFDQPQEQGETFEPFQDSGEALSLISAQAQEILASARKEADSIKSGALVEAQVEIENLRQSTYEEARAQGYDEGYHEAIEQVERQKQQLVNEQKRLEDEYQELVRSLEPKFVETLTDIYEKVFQIDLQKEHDIIMHLIASTMHKIEGNSNYLIHVSKEDYPYVNMKKNEMLLSSVSANASVELVEDMTLGPNDCIIETDGGIFDCGLGTQLEELTQKLRLLSYRVD